MNQNLYSNGAVPQPNPSYPMAGMHSSAYAPPLNYNQPTEVVGGYDAQINPMTGQEIPQTNFARGGNVNSEAGLASLLASRGRNGDSMLVHMAPNEVKGLQSLAMAHGGSLTINPDTGLYEASFLKKLLPTLLGVGLSFIPGIGPLAAAGEQYGGCCLRALERGGVRRHGEAAMDRLDSGECDGVACHLVRGHRLFMGLARDPCLRSRACGDRDRPRAAGPGRRPDRDAPPRSGGVRMGSGPRDRGLHADRVEQSRDDTCASRCGGHRACRCLAAHAEGRPDLRGRCRVTGIEPDRIDV